MKRNKPEGLTTVNEHAYFHADVEKPNQTDPEFITYDLACNEDFALHAKYHEWEKIFEFFRTHPIAKATLATKIIPIKFLDYDPEKKVRIRFSLMPEKIRQIVEPNTNKTIDKIKAINVFIEAGYDVHVNYSPVIVYDGWQQDYEEVFSMMRDYVEYKDEVLAEVIFLTHNTSKHDYNLLNKIPGENLLWRPDIQEAKTSSYGSKNLRYEHRQKAKFIHEFKQLHNSIIPWNTVRYIF
jgi:spore photoproduct lyase